jgi:hypothetical protein
MERIAAWCGIVGRVGMIRALREKFRGEPAWLKAGVLYLLLADFWLAKMSSVGKLPIFALFLLFLYLYLNSNQRLFVPSFRQFLPTMFTILLIVFAFNMVAGIGVSGGAVLKRYIVTLTYAIVGWAVFSRLGLRWMIGVLTTTFIIRSMSALPYLYSHRQEAFSVSRQLHQITTGGIDLRSTTEFLVGVGKYEFYTALGLAFILLVGLALSSKGRLKWLLLGASAIVAGNILLAGYLLPIVLAAMGLGLLMLQFKGSRTLILIVAVLMLVWVVPNLTNTSGEYTGVPVLDKMIGKFVSQYELASRAGIFQGTHRGRLYSISIKSFAQNPLFGIGPHEFNRTVGDYGSLGQHSAIFDWLAQYGIGIIMFFLAFWGTIYRSARQMFRDGETVLGRATLAFLIITIVAMFINPFFLKDSIDLIAVGWVAALHRYLELNTQPAAEMMDDKNVGAIA